MPAKPADFLANHPDSVVIDVRAPAEYAKGHIPGAVSLPLFDDDERAEVGTLYAQHGRDIATKAGLEIVGPKMKQIVTQAETIADGKKVMVYLCSLFLFLFYP